MSEFDRLGEALREQLHAIVEDLQPSAELSAAVDALPSARPARPGFLGRLSRRRIAIAVPVPIAGMVAAAVLLFAGSGPSSSVAGGIVVLPNGSIRVSPTEIANPAAANAVLRRHHIHNVVVVPMTASCPDQDWTYTLDGYTVGVRNKYGRTLGAMFLTPSTVPKGSTVVFAAKRANRKMGITAPTNIVKARNGKSK